MASMPLTIADNIVHQNSGGTSTSSTSTAITVSLAGADTTEADNVVLVFLSGSDSSTIFPTVSGWRRVYGGTADITFYVRSSADGLAAGESSWNFTPSVSPGGPVVWAVLELSGVDAVEVIDAAVQAAKDAASGTVTTMSSTNPTTTYDGLFFAVHLFRDADNTTPATWGSHTASYTEVLEAGQGGSTASIGMSISALPVQTIGTFPLAATANRTFLANEVTRVSFSVFAQNAPRQTDMINLDGGESYQVGTATAGVTLDAAAARSGAVGYLLSSTAAACNKTFTTGSSGTYPAYRWCFQVPDLNDRSEIAYFTISVSGGSGAKTLTLRMTGGQLGLNWSGGVTSGGEQLSDQSITADQWIGIDLRIDRRTANAYTVEWAVDYNADLSDTTPGVRQTAATATNATGTFLSLTPRVGWSSALTSTMWVDDHAVTPGYNFPIGDLRVIPLKVDSAGTPSVTGSTANFGVMTSNGTVAAWNATNARNAVDDIPPIAAGNGSRDAAVAILAHATDTANFPMETYDLAANKVAARGVKAHWWLWAASGTATTIRIFVSDGTDVHTMYAEADPGADNVTQVYSSAVVRVSASAPPDWTQSKVNSLEFRFGSNDANPDIGLDAMLLELAVVKAVPETLFGESSEPVYVQAHRDPSTYALVGATVTNNSGDPIELAWEVSGVPDTSGSIPDGTSNQYVPMSADGTIETVNWVSVIPG
jgi:hypothetical protein